jgi:hypothetical protein
MYNISVAELGLYYVNDAAEWGDAIHKMKVGALVFGLASLAFAAAEPALRVRDIPHIIRFLACGYFRRRHK